MIVKLSTDSIRTIATFEKITKVTPKDCIITENCIYFLVDPTKIGLAIGKNGFVIKELRRVFGKPIKIFGYSSNPEELVRNLISNLKSFDISNGTITVTVQPQDRMSVIGRNGSNIKVIRQILERHCHIKEFKLR
jgi:N utilization substance protein A